MTIEIKLLEKIFQKVAAGAPGDCLLPEPGHGAPPIEHPELLAIGKQPAGFDYDEFDNKAEKERFRTVVESALTAGEITQAQADRIFKAELNQRHSIRSPGSPHSNRSLWKTRL